MPDQPPLSECIDNLCAIIRELPTVIGEWECKVERSKSRCHTCHQEFRKGERVRTITEGVATVHHTHAGKCPPRRSQYQQWLPRS